MKVFVAGATGAIGRRLVPLLVAHGHDVSAMTRSPTKPRLLRAFGAEAVHGGVIWHPGVRSLCQHC